jgi:short-subunit dehydrogenase
MTTVLPSAWKTIWITGASTGIGRELALKLAAAGATVAVSARSAEKLAELASASPNIRAFPLDVTDLEATKIVAANIVADIGPIDLAILGAGLWIPMSGDTFDAAALTQSMAVNYSGTANAIGALLTGMTSRKSGHIAVIASVAGYRGLPQAVAYAPTKAALINLCETLYLDLKRHGVAITVVNPGFVDTPMTKVNEFPMPFLIGPQEAADTIIKGLSRGGFEIVFPWQMAAMTKTTRIMPYRLFFALTNLITPKPKS